MRIILADDSDLILDRLQEMLCVYSTAEIVASLKNGTEALAAIRTMEPDLVILDIDMPGLTGLQVLKEIRKEKKNNIPKFIILTLYSSVYYREMAIAAGADYFFSKADDFEKIGEVVGGMIGEDVTRRT
jgi:DNA-binding NarL/FixJ family response regulator